VIIESSPGLATDGLSIWESISKPAPPTSAFAGRADVDIAIIGAGIAGLSLAFHLAAAGKSPIVLEAAKCGSGASGASAGIVAPQLVRTTPQRVQERLGRERATRLLRLLAEAGDYTFALVREQKLDCGAAQAGFLTPARSASGARRLQVVVQQWQAFRSDLRWLDARTLSAFSGCEGYDGALLDRSGGGLNPLAYARELLRVAGGAGASIHEDSRVVELTRAGKSGWRIYTEQGEITAARVVLCANGGNGNLHAALRHSVLPFGVYEVATEAQSADVVAATLPGNHALTDVENDVFSLRWAPGPRLITAYPAGAGVDRGLIEAAVSRRLSAILHRQERWRLEFIWHGVAWINQGLLPRLVRVEDDLFAVQACNGRGIALNTVIGREMARWLLMPQSYTPAVSFEAPSRVHGFGMMRHVPQLFMSAATIASRLTAWVNARTNART
jgi:glycine/D-amino acid oxidase-like deaminating enzyme